MTLGAVERHRAAPLQRKSSRRAQVISIPVGLPLSVVVVAYDIARELPRTLHSLSATYQRDIAADDGSFEDAPRERKTSRTTGCKSYFPSVGMTLSVPCD